MPTSKELFQKCTCCRKSCTYVQIFGPQKHLHHFSRWCPGALGFWYFFLVFLRMTPEESIMNPSFVNKIQKIKFKRYRSIRFIDKQNSSCSSWKVYYLFQIHYLRCRTYSIRIKSVLGNSSIAWAFQTTTKNSVVNKLPLQRTHAIIALCGITNI